MKFDFKNKTYTLRNGSEYRNYCDNAGGKYPIHGAYKVNGKWDFIPHTSNGKFFVDREYCEYDLIEAKKTHTVTFWVNYYPDGGVSVWSSKELADKAARETRIACLEFTRTFTEGEGVENKP